MFQRIYQRISFNFLKALFNFFLLLLILLVSSKGSTDTDLIRMMLKLTSYLTSSMKPTYSFLLQKEAGISISRAKAAAEDSPHEKLLGQDCERSLQLATDMKDFRPVLQACVLSTGPPETV